MRNPMFASHMPAAIAITNLFPFQMAMLAMSMSNCLGKVVILLQMYNRTYL